MNHFLKAMLVFYARKYFLLNPFSNFGFVSFFFFFLQIAGPFSFRAESGVTLDLRNHNWNIHIEEPMFAIEYALHVLGSAKAIAWYSPKQQEFMVELRFFET